MSERNDGGPAYPVPDNVAWDESNHTAVTGLSKRDYLAAKAMQGEIAATAGGQQPGDVEAIAHFAYGVADAMILERDR